MIKFSEILFLSPEIFLCFSILYLLILGVFNTNRVIYALSSLTLFLIFLLYINSYNFHDIIINNMYLLNNLTVNSKIIIILSGLTVLLMSYDYLNNESISSFEYYVLILLAILGILFLISGYNLIIIYLAIELQSLAFYVLATLKKNSELSVEAGLKYFILGSLASGFLLFGMSLLYGFTGSISLYDYSHLFLYLNSNSPFQGDYGITTGLLFILIGIFFKLAAAPFHMWAPDVYEGSPTIVTAFFAIVPKLGLFSVLINIFFNSNLYLLNNSMNIIILTSILSMIIGAFGALGQYNLKRFLAFSSINNVGYLLLGIISNLSQSIQSIYLYLIIYIIMSINIFSIILSLRNFNTNKLIKNMEDLKGLKDINPVIAITLTLTLFSLAGIPPLAGFFSKLLILYSTIQSHYYFLAIIAILTSAISAFYYLRIIRIMYFDTPSTLSFYKVDFTKSLILAFSFLFILFFLFNPSFFLFFTHQFIYNL